MSDTLRKYWEKMEDSTPDKQKKLLQQLFDGDPNYSHELDSDDDIREQRKINKTAYRILSEYDEKDILQAAYIIRRTNSERGLEWDVTD